MSRVRDLDPSGKIHCQEYQSESEEESDFHINRCRILPIYLIDRWLVRSQMSLIIVPFIWWAQNQWWRPFFPKFSGILSFMTVSVGCILCLQRLWVPTQESEYFPSWSWSCVLFLRYGRHFSHQLKDLCCNTVKCKPQIVFHFFWKTKFVF